jgi:hypothetical protein
MDEPTRAGCRSPGGSGQRRWRNRAFPTVNGATPTETPERPDLFRHKFLALLRDRELPAQERIELLPSWRNSGFAVHNRTTVYPHDSEGLHKLACYFMRPPVNLSRLRYQRD